MGTPFSEGCDFLFKKDMGVEDAKVEAVED